MVNEFKEFEKKTHKLQAQNAKVYMKNRYIITNSTYKILPYPHDQWCFFGNPYNIKQKQL